MSQHWQASVATARGATGIKTAIGTIIVPKGASKIKAIWSVVLGGAVLTTAESISGILEIESADISGPLQFPLDQENMLTGGDAHLPAHIIPTNIDVAGGASIVGSITLDDTVTGALLFRWGICTE
jgi:hypothetical protein